MKDPDGNELPDRIYLHEGGVPVGSVNVPDFNSAAVRLVFNLAANSSDNDELSRILEASAAEVPPDVAADFFSAALGMMTTTIVELILKELDRVDPGNDVRLRLLGHATDANVRMHQDPRSPGETS
ncbi:hypothetical protein ACFTWF_03185 [Rhodococcus sp. NPDC056960]|uniref:hypothetical protein n=1 Tax=Rhodococcus sp. NPDC056960 TaxID=3345982 RepID=UPI00363317A6